MPKLLRVTISALWFGQLCQNRLHFEYDQDNNPVYLTDMATRIETGWIPIIRPATNNDVNFFNIKVDDISAGNGGPTFTKTINIPGSGGADSAAPLGNAFVLRLLTGFSGRKNRGRIYAFGQSPGHTTAGLVNQTGLNRWATPISNLKLSFVDGGANTNGVKLVIRGEGQNLANTVLVKDIQLRTTVGSMRRRMVGVGN